MNIETDTYPSGSIEYEFKMYASYDHAIACSLEHPDVREVILEKVNSVDEFDPKWRVSIQIRPVSSIDQVDEIGSAVKDVLFDMLSFTLKTNITDIIRTGHSLTPCPGEGAILIGGGFQSMPQMSVKIGCVKLSDKCVHGIQDSVSSVSCSQRIPYLSLFRYAIESTDPVVQFLMLYLILLNAYECQKKVDEQILKIAPEEKTRVSPSPRNKKIIETIYTKLRNEIAHRRDVSPDTTRAEIMNCLDNFREIIHESLVGWISEEKKRVGSITE